MAKYYRTYNAVWVLFWTFHIFCLFFLPTTIVCQLIILYWVVNYRNISLFIASKFICHHKNN